MKYAFKLTRDRAKYEIRVSDIFPVPDDDESKHVQHTFCIVRTQVYDTYEEALEARKNELIVVEFTKKPQEELRQMFKADMEIIKKYLPYTNGGYPGLLSWKDIMNRDSYYAYRTGIIPMDARVTARMHIIAGMLKPVKEIIDAIPKVLPGLGGGKPYNTQKSKVS